MEDGNLCSLTKDVMGSTEEDVSRTELTEAVDRLFEANLRSKAAVTITSTTFVHSVLQLRGQISYLTTRMKLVRKHASQLKEVLLLE